MSQRATNFLWVGSHNGLDLVNTEAVDDRGDRIELVPDFVALVDWAQAAGLIDAHVAGRCRTATAPQQRNVLAWFRTLRTCLRTVLDGTDEESSVHLDSVVGEVPVRLGQTTSGLPVVADRPLEQLRLALAVTSIDATRLDRSRVRRCANGRCILLYHDTTKNRSRRWCDMATCGNRAKASAHYHRTRRTASHAAM
jgi:predicted RNA-binding Zn ribbon-like protein